MRIGFYADNYKPGYYGGVDDWFINSIRALAEHAPEHCYIVLSNRTNHEILRKTFSQDAIDIVNVGHTPKSYSILQKIKHLAPFASRQAVKSVSDKVNDLNLDLVSFQRQLVWLENLQSPVILTLFDIQHEYFPEFFVSDDLAFRKAQYRNSVQIASHIVAASAFTAQTISEKFPGNDDKVSIIYPGFSANAALVLDKDTILKSFAIPKDFILFPANPWFHKNHARLFAALRQIRDRHGVMIPLVCIGRLSTATADTIQAIATAAEIEDQVYDLGFVSEEVKTALYKEARAMVFPSLFEGFGFPILEAMNWQCPVACSKIASLPEVAGDAALYFDPYDVDNIAQAIYEIWTNDELRQNLRSKGLQNIKRFSWNTYVKDMIALFTRYVQQ